MGGESKHEDARTELMEKKCSTQQAMKEFKHVVRNVIKIAGKEEDDWLLGASQSLMSRFNPLGIENKQASIRGAIRLDDEKAEKVVEQIIELSPKT